MQYMLDRKSGNKLSVLGFGCMRFPMDRRKTERLIVQAVDKGVNYFDTAYLYPNSETTLGGILDKNNLRSKVYLATKLPHMKCNVYADFDKIFNVQLERLKTDYIDYYLIHNLSDLSAWRRLCDLGAEKWIEEKKAAGQIRQIGFSFHGAQNDFMDLIDAYDWDFCQIQYNYADENYQAGKTGLKAAYDKGLAVIVMEPLLGGRLANGLPPGAVKIFKAYDAGRSAASWAFRWLWDQREVTVVLSGMNGEDQLDDNIKSAETAEPGMLPAKEAAVFEPVTAVLHEAYKVPCTGCNYCMPCPHGVNIPACFTAYNTSYAMGYVAGFTQYLTGVGVNNKEKRSRAVLCVKCGACAGKCPQNIDIPVSLDAVKKRMEPFWLDALLWMVQKVMR